MYTYRSKSVAYYQAPGLALGDDGTFSAPARVVVGGALDVSGDAFLGGSLVVSGSVMGSGAYVDSSDSRFKRDLRPPAPL